MAVLIGFGKELLCGRVVEEAVRAAGDEAGDHLVDAVRDGGAIVRILQAVGALDDLSGQLHK